MTKTSKKAAKQTTKRASKAAQRSRKQIRQSAKASQRVPKRPRSAKAKTTKPRKATKAPKFKSPYARVDGNAYRPNSSYGAAVDILAGHPDGMTRQALVEELAKVTGKPVKNCSFDVSVVLSAAEGAKLHSSARRGPYTIEKTNNHVRLVRGK